MEELITRITIIKDYICKTNIQDRNWGNEGTIRLHQITARQEGGTKMRKGEGVRAIENVKCKK